MPIKTDSSMSAKAWIKAKDDLGLTHRGVCKAFGVTLSTSQRFLKDGPNATAALLMKMYQKHGIPKELQ